MRACALRETERTCTISHVFEKGDSLWRLRTTDKIKPAALLLEILPSVWCNFSNY